MFGDRRDITSRRKRQKSPRGTEEHHREDVPVSTKRHAWFWPQSALFHRSQPENRSRRRRPASKSLAERPDSQCPIACFPASMQAA